MLQPEIILQIVACNNQLKNRKDNFWKILLTQEPPSQIMTTNKWPYKQKIDITTIFRESVK